MSSKDNINRLPASFPTASERPQWVNLEGEEMR